MTYLVLMTGKRFIIRVIIINLTLKLAEPFSTLLAEKRVLPTAARIPKMQPELAFVISLAMTHCRAAPRTATMSSRTTATECGGAYRINVACTPRTHTHQPDTATSGCDSDSAEVLGNRQILLSVAAQASTETLAFILVWSACFHMHDCEACFAQDIKNTAMQCNTAVHLLAVAAASVAGKIWLVETPQTGKHQLAAQKPPETPTQQMAL